jgi:arginase family enzyme
VEFSAEILCASFVGRGDVFVQVSAHFDFRDARSGDKFNNFYPLARYAR